MNNTGEAFDVLLSGAVFESLTFFLGYVTIYEKNRVIKGEYPLYPL